MSEVLIVIPARYGSTRLPGKPLKAIAGVEMIKRVADIAAHVCSNYDNCMYLVATDNELVESFCHENSIPSAMTAESCKSGTDRSWDAVQQFETKPKFIINLQGDNPLCPPWFIAALIDEWQRTQIEGVYTAFVTMDWQELDQLRETKLVTPHSGTTVQIDKQGYALTFSKAILPVIRKEDKMREQQALSPVKRHIGLYAYTYDALQDFFKWDSGVYEGCEGLEQMRFLENGTPIKMVKVDYQGRIGMSGVDSIEDIKRAENIIAECGEFSFYDHKVRSIALQVCEFSYQEMERVFEHLNMQHWDITEARKEFEAILNESMKGFVANSSPKFTVVSGIPFAGKSTFIYSQQERFADCLFVSFDKLMKQLSRYQQQMQVDTRAAFEECELIARILGYELLARAVENNVNIVLEHSSTPEPHVELYRWLKESTSYQVAFVHINIELKEARARAQSANQDRDDGRYTPLKYIEERYQSLQNMLDKYRQFLTLEVIEQNVQTKTNIVFVRHGNTFKKGDVLLRVGSRTDLDLVESEKGTKAGQYIAKQGYEINAIYSGPLKRHIQTASLIAKQVNISPDDICIAEALNELDYGSHDGMPEEEVINLVGEQALKNWDETATPPPEWNVDVDNIKGNLSAFLQMIIQHHQGEDVVVVTSNGLLRFLPFIIGAEATTLTLKVATGGIVELQSTGSWGWKVKTWGVKP